MKRLCAVLVLSLVMAGCETHGPVGEAQNPVWAPAGAVECVNLGNGWYTFVWNGKKFLVHREGFGNAVTESMTQVH